MIGSVRSRSEDDGRRRRVIGYVDPSAGGLLFQVLAVIAVAISGSLLFFSRQLKAARARVKRFIHERRSRS